MNTLFGTNWRTTLSGWITVLASAIAVNPSIVAFLPEPLRDYVTGLAGLVAVVSGGTFAYNAKDKQVTGSSTGTGTTLPLILLFGVLGFSVGCAAYEKLTGLSSAQVSQIGSTAEQQTLTNLYNGVASATSQSLPALSGPEAQNGQDVIDAAWIGAGEAAGINTLGDLIVDYGGPLLKGLGNYIDSEIGNLPTSLQTAAKNTAAAAVQNVINAAAPSSAQPTDDIQSTPAVTGTAVPDDSVETTPIAQGGN